jgi:predicted glutamine amidotransferase
MCELLGMSSSRPATVNLSLMRLAEHGGFTGPHRDGWGIAYYEGPDVRLIKEAEAATGSAWVVFVEGHDLRSPIVVAHIRRATMGERSIATRNRSRGSLPDACICLPTTAGFPVSRELRR